VGTALTVFSQTLGGAIFVSVAENIFTNRLVAYLTLYVPDLDPDIVLAVGATVRPSPKHSWWLLDWRVLLSWAVALWIRGASRATRRTRKLRGIR
jgi:hypothetical protein